MDGIGFGGELFIVVAAIAGFALFVGVPAVAAADVYREREHLKYPWLMIAGLLATIPFGVGLLLGIAYFVVKGKKPAATATPRRTP